MNPRPTFCVSGFLQALELLARSRNGEQNQFLFNSAYLPGMARQPEAPKFSAAAAARSSPDGEAREASFCVVGLGASAGGLEAFRQLLTALPADTGLGFVVVQHLAPTYASSLAEILSRSTPMTVIEVKDEPRVESNHVYVIPPGKTMVIVERNLKLQPREQNGQHHPIDIFFKSLAQD